MRTPHYASLAHAVQQQTVGLLAQRLRPDDYSRRCTAWTLLRCLVAPLRSVPTTAACIATDVPGEDWLCRRSVLAIPAQGRAAFR